jgi:nitrate reductase NapAB chaperone NapD
MTMPRLDFDFHAQPSRPSVLPLALALVGATAMAWVWVNLQAARATEAGLAMQIAALERAPSHPAAKPVSHADDAARATRAHVAAQLKFSWQPAFDALAAARTSKIALVSLDAVQATSRLKLVAEARTLADVIAYVEALQQQPGIRSVELLQHEVQEDDAQKPLRVSILVELAS